MPITTPPTSAPRTTSDGWVTYSRTHIPGVGAVLIQKRDGCTRTVPATGR